MTDWIRNNFQLLLGALFLIGGIGSIGAGTFGIWKFQFGETSTGLVCFIVGFALLVVFFFQKRSGKKEE